MSVKATESIGRLLYSFRGDVCRILAGPHWPERRSEATRPDNFPLDLEGVDYADDRPTAQVERVDRPIPVNNPPLSRFNSSWYNPRMSAEVVIEQIRMLAPDEVEKVSEFLAEWEADRISAERDHEIDEHKVSPLSQEDVFSQLKARLG